MTRSLKTVVDSLAEKVRILSLQKETTEGENRKLRELLEHSQLELEECKQTNRKLEQDIEYLILSHRLADSPESLVESRKIISALIRKIDRCISLLKDDAEI